MPSGLVFNVQRFSLHDGPGLRSTVFMKGCPLSCGWCHNPESQSPEVQKLYTASKCIGAQDCIELCPENALTLTTDGIVTDNEKCTLCGKCAEACPSKAIEMSGKLYGVEDLMRIIERERVHIEHSNGGVTFSGGEPLMYPGFLIEMLKACGEKGLHRAVDTCGFASPETLLEVAKHIFTWYVRSVVELGKIYGPLTAFISFLLWVFYSSSIFLIGAEIVHNSGISRKGRGAT